VANKLAELTDQLNEKIRDIERGLEALGLGVTAMVPIPGPWGARSLEFAKHENKWRLTVVSDESATPLLNASRGVRCAAMAALSSLLEMMRKRVAQDADQVQAALSRADNFLAAIGAGGNRAE
jgi:hypothetical protein